jgi:signal transduction histidine kinase
MQRGERAYDRRACDLREVLDEAVALFAPIAEREGLQLRVRAADVPAPACADRGALLQALLNVLDNGRKYGAAGGAIEVATGRREGRFELRVRDFGPGVPASERAAIFGQFQRGTAHQDGAIPGVGLGLHLSRAILRHHGGDLVCRGPADGGVGAEFALTLPLAAVPTPAPAREQAS